MIKLKNSEISAFSNPIIGKLLDDPDRKFPIADAFIFADLLDQIQTKFKTHLKCTKDIIAQNKGKVDNNGLVTCENREDLAKINQELDELNAVEVEIIGDKMVWKDSWPALSIREACILKPLIKGE